MKKFDSSVYFFTIILGFLLESSFSRMLFWCNLIFKKVRCFTGYTSLQYVMKYTVAVYCDFRVLYVYKRMGFSFWGWGEVSGSQDYNECTITIIVWAQETIQLWGSQACLCSQLEPTGSARQLSRGSCANVAAWPWCLLCTQASIWGCFFIR